MGLGFELARRGTYDSAANRISCLYAFASGGRSFKLLSSRSVVSIRSASALILASVSFDSRRFPSRLLILARVHVHPTAMMVQIIANIRRTPTVFTNSV